MVGGKSEPAFGKPTGRLCRNIESTRRKTHPQRASARPFPNLSQLPGDGRVLPLADDRKPSGPRKGKST